ncbi:MAG: hypothetical protein U0840_04110 [Gemmataceae bacterium]
MLPGKHLADTGYADAELLVKSRQEFGVDLVGRRGRTITGCPLRQGFAAGDFRVTGTPAPDVPGRSDEQRPAPGVDGRDNEVIKVKFLARDCGLAPARRNAEGDAAVGDDPPEQYER